MVDKGLKIEKKMHRYSYNKVKRVKSYGYGKNDKYRNKPKAVCYWTQEGGNFVVYERSKIEKILVRIRYKLRFTLPYKLWNLKQLIIKNK